MKTIQIKGMSCNHCVRAVTKAISAVDGITSVNVDLETSTASYEEAKPVEMQAIVAAVKKAGYDVAQ